MDFDFRQHPGAPTSFPFQIITSWLVSLLLGICSILIAATIICIRSKSEQIAFVIKNCLWPQSTPWIKSQRHKPDYRVPVPIQPEPWKCSPVPLHTPKCSKCSLHTPGPGVCCSTRTPISLGWDKLFPSWVRPSSVLEVFSEFQRQPQSVHLPNIFTFSELPSPSHLGVLVGLPGTATIPPGCRDGQWPRPT